MPPISPTAAESLRQHLAPELQERIQLLETLLRDTEAAELMHQNCWFCSGESSPLRCERCAVMYADLRERRNEALLGEKGISHECR